MDDPSATVRVDLDMQELLSVLKHYNGGEFAKIHNKSANLLGYEKEIEGTGSWEPVDPF